MGLRLFRLSYLPLLYVPCLASADIGRHDGTVVRLAQLIVQRAVLHRYKVRTLRLQRILLALPVPHPMMADVVVVVLQTAILGPRTHIVGLVRITTR